MRTRLVSFGKGLPKRVVTNKELEPLMNTTDEWIQTRSGIKERRWISPGETCLSLAVEASKEAIDKAGLQADDIDAIVFACMMSDFPFPGTGPLVQQALGCKKTIPAIDIRVQCSGFLYSMSVADAWIRSGFYKRVLIIGSEVQSTTLDISPRGRDNAVLFGDGAGALIVEATTDSTNCVLDMVLHSEGEWAQKLGLFKPSPNDFPRLGEGQVMGADVYGVMEGRFVFKHAVQRMSESIVEICQRNSLTPDKIDFVIAHQANRRIIEAVLDQFKIPESKTHYTLDRYGNTTAATIPLTMGEAVELGKIKRGDLILWVAFGSGFAWGATLMRY